ncbi:MAG: hypothetical protein OEM82_03055 [Acidobacteriota bacterium]|nr:hypothetical protein [Acidobacteriota bacterium]
MACGLLILFLCSANPGFAQDAETAKPGDKTIKFEHLALKICEDQGRSFEISVSGGTATVKAGSNEDFGGITLCFARDRVKFLNAWAEYDFGVLQYLFDDKTAAPIDTTISFTPAALEVDFGTIVLPQTYDDFEGVESIAERLGYSNIQEFDQAFESNHIEKIKAKSLKIQREFYTSQLNKNRDALAECCSESIDQAEAFLRKRDSDFTSFEQLGVEIYRKKTVIRIEGTTTEGVDFEYRIIDDN